MAIIVRSMLVVFAVGSVVGGEYYAPSTEELNARFWAAERYEKVIKAVMPVGPETTNEDCEDCRWRVEVRIIPEPGDMELLFNMKKTDDSKINLTVIRPSEDSILGQLERISTLEPSISEDELKSLIRVEIITLSEQDCMAIRSLARKYERIRFPSVLPARLVLHATAYELWSAGPFGDWQHLYINNGLRQGIRDRSHPALPWIEAVRRTIEECSTPPK